MLYKNNLEVERVRHRMSKQAVAKELDVTTKTYSNYVNGCPIPSTKLLSLARLFECSTDYLLGLKEDRSVSDGSYRAS